MTLSQTPVKYAATINRTVLPESTPGDYPFKYIDISAVNGTGAISVPDEWTLFSGAPSRARRIAPPGSTIVSTVRTYLRAVAAVPTSDEPLVFSTGFATLEAAPGTDGRFLAYACRSNQFIDEVVARSTGVSYPAINPSDLGRVRIPLPSIPEQRRIADFLDDQATRIDQIVAARHQQLSLMTAHYDAKRDEHLCALGTEYEWTTLRRRVTGIQQGWSPDCDQMPASPEEWGVLKVGAVKRGSFRPEENKRLPDAQLPRPELRVRPDDLLFSRANTRELVGDCCVVPEGVPGNLLLCDKIMRVSLDALARPGYVALAAGGSKARSHFSNLASGTSGSMVNIRAEDVREMPLPMPPQTAQLAAETLFKTLRSDIDRLANLMRTSIDSLQELKRSLISAAVSGEFDVSAASGRGVPV